MDYFEQIMDNDDMLFYWINNAACWTGKSNNTTH